MARTSSVNDTAQDLDPSISPAPNDQPTRPTSPSAKAKLIKKSVEKGVFVTVAREGAINGRTHTGVLHEVEAASGEGEDAIEASYAIRTGQPGRPVTVKVSDIRTITEAETPVVASDNN